jgi:hypothetical protein
LWLGSAAGTIAEFVSQATIARPPPSQPPDQQSPNAAPSAVAEEAIIIV